MEAAPNGVRETHWFLVRVIRIVVDHNISPSSVNRRVPDWHILSTIEQIHLQKSDATLNNNRKRQYLHSSDARGLYLQLEYQDQSIRQKLKWPVRTTSHLEPVPHLCTWDLLMNGRREARTRRRQTKWPRQWFRFRVSVYIEVGWRAWTHRTDNPPSRRWNMPLEGLLSK